MGDNAEYILLIKTIRLNCAYTTHTHPRIQTHTHTHRIVCMEYEFMEPFLKF